jgi:Calcineurin-like phosphoesterase
VTFKRYILIIIVLFLMNACATYKPQYKDGYSVESTTEDKEIEHSFYLIGDAGNSPIGSSSDALKTFKNELTKASKNSTALFLGDNIYPNGLPKKEKEERAFAEHQLNMQVDAVKDFKGQTIFIPGNHDWYNNGLEGLKRQENYIENALGKDTFFPENGCPMKVLDISKDIVLIVIDSEWYLTNWDHHPTINDDCDIKTRAKFFEEFESEIKKAEGKTTIVAIHHPVFTNGSHGGQYAFASHLSPVPVLGTLKNIIRKTGGVSPQDIQNARYNEFRKRIITLSQGNDKTIFVSGHDHNLQYLVKDNLPQIISGSGSKATATRNVDGGVFSYGSPGFARLDVFKDGSSIIQFHSVKKGGIVFQTEVLSEDEKDKKYHHTETFPKEKSASIYTEAETTKGSIYKLFWGNRYREDYSKPVQVPVVNLDTLFGGLKPIRAGGGHQSKSLRLKDNEGREYVMRALRKNAVQYLQAVAFKDEYIEGQFEGTYTEGLLQDVFAGSHPYAPFVIGKLADGAGVFHTNPILYYVPKQNALGAFNDAFGDELYMIEERADSGHGNQASFGFSNEMISTDDLLKKLHEDEDFVLDEASYIRARLFDMLIGDWDRHEDQWRWASFKEDIKTVYKPVPRDRDQAFSIMADGLLLGLATKIIPSLRLMQSYDDELKSPKWFNLEPYPLDMALINQSDKMVWDAQVKYIMDNLTDAVIEEAFSKFPSEVNQKTIQEIKQKLKGRRANLQKISDAYYNHINKYAVVKGTDKDDWFDVERLLDGQTKVTGYRIKKGEKSDVFHQRIYSDKETKEIWIYGLDDDDVFHVYGEGDAMIKMRIIGGQNKDVYNIANGKKLNIYDYKTKDNEFVTHEGNKKLTDDYETNTYDHKKLKNDSNQFIPSIGANPDDGLKIGFVNTYTNFGFERNPFTSQHALSAAHYFATSGFEIGYQGEFAHVVGKMNLGLKLDFTSPNFSVNFFGFGNSTPNLNVDDDSYTMDYNRVRLSTIKVAPSLHWRGDFGTHIKFLLSYESIEVEETTDRFINTFYLSNGEENHKSFIGSEVSYTYKNQDNKAFPTLGMEANLQMGFKSDVEDSKSFGYVMPSLAFDQKLIPNGQVVLATKVKGHVIFGDDFEFYQSASIGGDDGLRAFRNQRFSGKNSFYQTTDIRFNLRKIKTGLLPLNIGFYGGFDYGRIWIDNNLVLNSNPDFNANSWNTSLGGGVFANAANMLTFNMSAFHGNDGLRLAFRMGFGF